MAAKLSDAEFIERHRAANRIRSQRTRERRYGAGRVALTVWVAESTKARLLALAAAESTPIAEVADRLLSAALAPTAIPVTPAPVELDTLPLFEPDSTESQPVDSDTDSDRHAALMLEVDRLVNAGEKWRDIARILNDAGWRDKKDRPLVFSRLNEQWRVWKQSL